MGGRMKKFHTLYCISHFRSSMLCMPPLGLGCSATKAYVEGQNSSYKVTMALQ